jgi:succinyl-CoA synthetase beta subunit
MIGDRLVFAVRSRGLVEVDLAKCAGCGSRVCIAVCTSQGGPLVIDTERGIPALKWSLDEVERGGCVECLGCELDCTLHGLGAVTITLPVQRLEEYLGGLAEPTVYSGAR